MAGGIFEQQLDLTVETVEAILPTSDSYPYPALTLDRAKTTRTFEAVVLENEYLKVTILPALGGRIWSIFDKRRNSEFLLDSPIVEGGRRGVVLDRGIRFSLDGRERLTDLGTVDFSISEGEGDRPDELWLAEATNGSNLSWHLRMWLQPEVASLHIEGRVLNRSLRSQRYDPRFLLGPHYGSLFCTWRDNSRFSDSKWLAAHQLDTWTVQLSPYSTLENALVGADVAIKLDPATLQVHAARQLLDAKIVLLTPSGTVEAKVSLYPEKVEALDVSQLGEISQVAILEETGKTLLSSMSTTPAEAANNEPVDVRGRSVEELTALTFRVADRHAAHFALGAIYLATHDLLEADYHFEQSLLYNGEDHLTWFARAAAERLVQKQDEESAFLLNAHFLAPLDPILRVEGFLRQQSEDSSALLKPMTSRPDDMIQATCDLIETGLNQDAARWVEACLTLEDIPMLRILRAYVLTRFSTMDFEARDDLSRAEAKPLAPPYPWRDIEREAITFLRNRFPSNERLIQLEELVNRTYLSSLSSRASF